MSIDKKWRFEKKSFWTNDQELGVVDVTIVGAGIVGLSLAISLSELLPKLSIKVVEAGTGSDGASSRNAGFACIGSISEIHSDISSMGISAASDVVRDRWQGLQLLKARVSDVAMDYDACGGYEVFEDQQTFERWSTVIPEINRLLAPIVDGQQCFSAKRHPLYGDTIYNKVEGSLNPVKMLQHLELKAKGSGVHVVYGTTVHEIDAARQKLCTCRGTMHSRAVVLCSNAWTSRLLPKLDVKPARNQVLVTRPIKDLPLKGTYHMYEGYVYFRNVGSRLLVGGGRHLQLETEATFDTTPRDDSILQYLQELIETRILPGTPYEIDQSWTGHLGVGRDKSPIIQKVSEGLWAAVRMGGMGVAIGSIVGQKAAKMLVEDWQQASSEIVMK